MKGARCRNHDPIEVQPKQVFKRRYEFRLRGEAGSPLEPNWREVGDCRCLDQPAIHHSLHPVKADPADTEKSDAGAYHGRGGATEVSICHGKVTAALRKPCGRSRVASRASPSRSSG